MHETPDIRRCLTEYRHNMKEDLLALWKVWVPSTVVNFAFMPMWARIPFVAATSLLWTMILSAMRGGDVTHGEDMAGGAVTGATLTMMESGLESLLSPDLELNPKKRHFMVTASGPDQVGWIANLARVIANAGGNVTHSKQVRLGSSFICILHLSVDPEEQTKLLRVLRRSPELKGLSVQCNSLSRRNTGTFTPAVMGVQLHCRGADQPGMLASVAESLASQGLNVEDVTTKVIVRKDGGHDFLIDADCTLGRVMNSQDIERMVSDLTAIKEELRLETVDIRVQRLVPSRKDTVIGDEREL